MLHIRCGDDILAKLQDAGLPGDRMRWADPLCEGPTPAGLSEDDFRAVRADWLSRRFAEAPARSMAYVRDQDAGLLRAAAADEVVLWFEHDLFDQAVLIHLLQRLRPLAESRMSLVCIGSHPDVEEFTGLGQLDAAQLGALFLERQPVTADQFDLAEAAWAAFAAPDPTSIQTLLAGDTAALPFLADALYRHLQQFPWRADGLALTEWLVLDVIDLGADTSGAAFRKVMLREPAPWQGDTMFLSWLRDLAVGANPLVAMTGDGSWDSSIRLTEQGRAVLLGKADGLEGRPLDRWLGGVHLVSGQPGWRWDASHGVLVAMDQL